MPNQDAEQNKTIGYLSGKMETLEKSVNILAGKFDNFIQSNNKGKEITKMYIDEKLKCYVRKEEVKEPLNLYNKSKNKLALLGVVLVIIIFLGVEGAKTFIQRIGEWIK
jgi:hypothetical protein